MAFLPDDRHYWYLSRDELINILRTMPETVTVYNVNTKEEVGPQYHGNEANPYMETDGVLRGWRPRPRKVLVSLTIEFVGEETQHIHSLVHPKPFAPPEENG